MTTARIYNSSTGNWDAVVGGPQGYQGSQGYQGFQGSQGFQGNQGTSSLTTNIAGKNSLINGAFDIWQRGTSFTSDQVYTADRWYGRVIGTSSITQETTNLPVGARYGLKWNITGTTAGSFCQIHQPIETANVIPLRGQTVTFSYYALVSGGWTGNIVPEIYYSNSATDASYTTLGSGTALSVTQNQANNAPTVWTRLSFTTTIPTDALSIRFGIVPDTAQSTNGATVRIANVQLELGSTATQFTRAGGLVQGELAACQRYYLQVTSDTNNSGAILSPLGTANTTSSFYVPFLLPVTMRAVPSGTVAFANLQAVDGANSFTITSAGLAGSSNTTQVVILNVGVTGTLTQFRPYWIRSAISGGYIGFTAEL